MMMRYAWVLAGVLIAACDPPGLTLEVTTFELPVKRVELFVGDACGSACPLAMAPPGLAPRRSDFYLVDDAETWFAVVVKDKAGFRLWSPDGDQKIPIIVAVGFDAEVGGNAIATATTRDVPVPANDSAYWQLPLVMATPITDGSGASDGERVKLWTRADAKLPACVMVEHWSAGVPKRDAVLPRADPDCDGISALNECAPFSPNAVSVPTTEPFASCFVSSVQGVCTLGGPPCDELTGSNPLACEPLNLPYCAPHAICSCAPHDLDCLLLTISSGTRGTSTGTMPFVECPIIPVDPASGSTCAAYDPTLATLDAAQFLSGSTKCKSIRVYKGMMPSGSFGSSLGFRGGTLTLENFRQPCAIDFKWSGVVPVTSGPAGELTFVDLELDNGNHLVVPFWFDLKFSCSEPMSCTAHRAQDLAETMFTCADPDVVVPPGACEPSGMCNGGPECGAICCTTGERCIGGQCVCGGTGGSCGPQGPDVTCQADMDPAAPGCGTGCCGSLTPVVCLW